MFTTSRSARSIAQRNQLRAAVVSIATITTITTDTDTGTGTGTGTIVITTSITGEGRCG